MPTNSKATV